MNSGRVLFAVVLAAGTVRAGDWPQFRGPGLGGFMAEARLAHQWAPHTNIRWKAALPGRGVSSPVVVGGRVYLTACSGMNQTRLHVLCFAADSGAKLWERQFWATGSTNCHPKTCVAAPTPVAGRGRLFALFGTGDLVCLNATGELCWLRCLQIDEPLMTNLVGRAGSPVLHENILIVPMESQGASFLFGLDATTGHNRWKVDRPLENSYTTPLLADGGGRTNLVVQAAGGLTAYDPTTGGKRWTHDDDGVSAIASPIAASGFVLASGRDMVALRLADAGPPVVAWRSARLGSGTATPLAVNDRVLALKDSGILACGDLRTGKEIWAERLRGSYSASPVLAGDLIYAVNEDGDTTVVRTGDTPKRIATNSLGDTMLASPAIAGDCLFLRSDGWLYCIATPPAVR